MLVEGEITANLAKKKVAAFSVHRADAIIYSNGYTSSEMIFENPFRFSIHSAQ
jgi:hypothetical protein